MLAFSTKYYKSNPSYPAYTIFEQKKNISIVQTNKQFTIRRKPIMSNRSSNKAAVPEAKSALDRFKYEVAGEIGVPLKDGYNGDLTSRQNGSVGGYMVKKMIEAQERQMSGK